MKQYKIVLLGKSGVGKSSIASRYINEIFEKDIQSTIGAAFMTKIININDSELKIDLWDTAGQERYNSMIPLYYRAAHAAIIVYDICDQSTFTCAKEWVIKLRQNNPKTIIYLVGNKIDLNGLRQVKFEIVANYIKINHLSHREVSAKNNTNISQTFNDIIDNLEDMKYFNPSSLKIHIEENKRQESIQYCC